LGPSRGLGSNNEIQSNAASGVAPVIQFLISVRVTVGRFQTGMADPLPLQIGRRAVLAQHRDTRVPERMQPGFWNSEFIEQRMQDPVADVARRERRAVSRLEDARPLTLADVFAQQCGQLGVDVDLANRILGLWIQLLAVPH